MINFYIIASFVIGFAYDFTGWDGTYWWITGVVIAAIKEMNKK